MQATNAGVLEISGSTITQGASGQLLANGSNVEFLSFGASNTTIRGGALNASGAGSFTVSGTTTLDSVTNYAPVNQSAGSVLNIAGNLVDNGRIVVNSNQVNGAVLSFNGGTVTGTVRSC